MESARAFYKSLRETNHRAFVPVYLVSLQADSGDLAGALRMLHDPDLFKGETPEQTANFQRDALVQVVVGLVPDRIGHPDANERRDADAIFKEALSFARRRVNPSNDLQYIAEAQARFGEFDEAVKTIGMIDVDSAPGSLTDAEKREYLDEHHYEKAQGLAHIALWQVEAGDLASARRTARESARVGRTIQDREKTFALLESARVMALADDLNNAMQLATEVQPSLETSVYDAIVRSCRERGNVEGARMAIRKAMQIVHKHLENVNTGMVKPDTPEGKQAHAWLESLGRYQAQLGDLKTAIATVLKINDGGREMEAMEHMAYDLAAAGDLDGALEVVDAMNSPKAEAKAMETVASAFSRREPSR